MNDYNRNAFNDPARSLFLYTPTLQDVTEVLILEFGQVIHSRLVTSLLVLWSVNPVAVAVYRVQVDFARVLACWKPYACDMLDA